MTAPTPARAPSRTALLEGGLWWDADGALRLENVRIRDLAQRFGTPLYVVSEARLRANARAFRQAFESRWPEGSVRVLPAIKANYGLALRAILTQEGFGCDVFSAGELWAALHCGVPPEQISLNGNGKLGRDRDVLRTAVAEGVRITLDHKDEFDAIEGIARELGRTARIRFRLRPDFPNLLQPSDLVGDLVPTELAINAYKSGMPTEDVVPLGRRALASDAVELVGVHIHIGRHRRETAFWRSIARGLAALLGRLKREWQGWEPREIDLGGGFAIRRDPTGRGIDRSGLASTALVTGLCRLAAPFGAAASHRVMRAALGLQRRWLKDWAAENPTADLGPTVDDYAVALLEVLRAELRRHGLEPAGKEIQIEPGRALYGDAGIHITRVNFVKAQREPVPWRWVNVDTSDAFLVDGSLEHSVFRFVTAAHPPGSASAAETMIADVVGSSCNADRILADVALPRATRAGDLLVLLDTGAYQDAGASNFNALGRPATVLVNGEEAEVVRAAETPEDVFRRDRVPERLRGALRSKAQ